MAEQKEVAMISSDPRITSDPTENSEAQKQHRVTIGLTSQNDNLSKHLNRVLKLIKQREQVEEAATPDLAVNKTDLTVIESNSRRNSTALASSVIKRTNTSLSCTPVSQSPPDLENGLGILRIVKSIHTKILHSSQKRQDTSASQVNEEDDSGVDLTPTSPFQSQVLTPQIHQQQQHPLGFYKGGQHKRNLVGGLSDLMLQGKVKPKAQRMSVPRRTHASVKRVASRENGCQTTPAVVMERDHDESIEESQVRNRERREADITETLRTKPLCRSRSPPLLNLDQQDGISQWRAPLKATMGQSSKSSQHHMQQSQRSVTPTILQQQRKFKMSVLKKDQAKAGQKFLSPTPPPGDIASEDQLLADTLLEESTQMNQTATAFNTSNSHTYNHKLHTAIRMSQRTNKQWNQRRMFNEANMQKQVFSQGQNSDDDNQRVSTTFSPAASNHRRQMLSGGFQGKSREPADRKVDSHLSTNPKKYISGAFEDHDNLKTFFDREKNRSRMRQEYMNKTQNFFPSTSRKETPTVEPSTKIEDVLVSQQCERRRNRYDARASVDQSPLTRNATTPLSEPSMQNQVIPTSAPQPKQISKLESRMKTGESSMQEPLFGDSVAFNNKELNDGSVSMMYEQSCLGEPDYHPLSDVLLGSPDELKSLEDTAVAYDESIMSKILLEQQLQHHKSMLSSMTGEIRLPSKLAANNLSTENPNHFRSQHHNLKSTSTPGTLDQAKHSIEKRLLNQIERDLDKTEVKVYEKHRKVSQLIFNDKEFELYNLVEHPEWCDLTTEMQSVYLQTLEDFNQQLIGQNYFIRGDVKSKRCQPAPNRSPKTSFLAKCMQRLQNLFNQHSFLLTQSRQQLTDLVADNKRLVEEISGLRKDRLIVKDHQHVVNELVNQFFAMGNDKDLKAGRLAEAEKFLQDQTITQMLEKEGRNNSTEQLDYSNTLVRLEEILRLMTLPNVINKGIQFDISQYVFDPRFTDKIKNLFESRIATAQNDAALRSLQTVFKEIQMNDVGIQTIADEIDCDINAELKFWRNETARLQAETNQTRMKMLLQEKNVKTAGKERTDALIGTQVLFDQVQEARRETEKQKVLAMQYKSMHTRATAESESMFITMGKLQTTVERVQKFGTECEALFEKMISIDGMKEVLIAEQDKLLSGISEAEGATKDIVKKFQQIKNFSKKVDVKNQDLKKIVAEYRKQQYEQTKPTVPKVKLNTSTPQVPMHEANEMTNKGKQKSRAPSAKKKKEEPAARKKSPRLGGSQPPPQAKKENLNNIKKVEAEVKPKEDKSKSTSPAPPKNISMNVGAKKGKQQVATKEPQTKKTLQVKADVLPKKSQKVAKVASSQVIHVSAPSKAAKSIRFNENEENEEDSTVKHDSVILVDDVDEIKGQVSQATGSKDPFESFVDTGTDQNHTISKKYTESMRASITISVKEVNVSALGNFIDGNIAKTLTQDKHKTQNFRDHHQLQVDSGRASTIMDVQEPGITARDSYRQEPMTPITSQITEKIIINSSFVEGAKTQQKKQVQTKEKSLQTDTEVFFQYIFDYLGELERRINGGEICFEDILQNGRERSEIGSTKRLKEGEVGTGTDNSTLREDELTGSEGQMPVPEAIAYQATSEDKRKIIFSIAELQECLRRLKSLTSHGGDIFFSGIVRTMVARPFIPQSFRQTLSVPNQVSKDKQDSPSKALIDQQKKRLQEMTRTRTSIAGGGGQVRDSPPSKAYRAATNLEQKGGSPFKHQSFQSPGPEFKLRAKITEDDLI